MGAFVKAVLRELELHQRTMPVTARTIYLGGGTPTALSEKHLADLLTGLKKAAAASGNTLDEFGLEANPKTVSASKARLLKDLGVTRISLGVQAWDEPTLKLLGRDHAPDEAESAGAGEFVDGVAAFDVGLELLAGHGRATGRCHRAARTAQAIFVEREAFLYLFGDFGGDAANSLVQGQLVGALDGPCPPAAERQTDTPQQNGPRTKRVGKRLQGSLLQALSASLFPSLVTCSPANWMAPG